MNFLNRYETSRGSKCTLLVAYPAFAEYHFVCNGVQLTPQLQAATKRTTVSNNIDFLPKLFDHKYIKDKK